MMMKFNKTNKLLEINKEGELHLPLLLFRDDVDIYKKKKKKILN